MKIKKERRGRNPATGDDMTLYQRLVVTFRCSLQLQDKLPGNSYVSILRRANYQGIRLNANDNVLV